MTSRSWFTSWSDDYRISRHVLPRLLTPALVVYLDKVRHNLEVMRGLLGGDFDRWRPHVKTTKIPEVWGELLRVGLRNFKCATTRELRCLLEVVRDADVEQVDILVAYPHGYPALGRIGSLAARYPRAQVSVLCEDPAAVKDVPDNLGVFVDVNPDMNRTGVPCRNLDGIRAIAGQAGARFRGLHFYDGHNRQGDMAERTRSTQPLYEVLLSVHGDLRQAGIVVPELVTSGTPSFPIALQFAPLQDLAETRHRISPGTIVYHDATSQALLPDLGFEPAAVVLSRVVSQPAAGLVTCDAGSKSLAAEVGDPCAHVLGRPELVAQRPSEEHLPLRVDSGVTPPRGELLWLVPTHVCPTVNLAEEALLVDGNSERVTNVVARAHELLVGPLPQ